MTPTAEQKFWVSVKRHPYGCWTWEKCRNKDGYGIFTPPGTTKNILSHRFSYETVFGPIPAGLCICHRCDSPPCVNPQHLFAGTKKENSHDMARKGRSGRMKISDDDVREVRTLLGAKVPHKTIATMFGISVGQVEKISSRASRFLVE